MTELLARDLRFTFDQVSKKLDGAPDEFRSRLDITRAGAFGHSRGGRAAVRLCQIDLRLKACVNQDGNMAWHPYWRDPSGRPLQQPFLMLDHLDPDWPGEVYRKMGTTREQYARRRAERQAEARDQLYATVAGGSYHVTITTPGVSHNSFLDIRLLGRAAK
ncbi:MAG TPA: hypothetical protein DEH78_05310 [Solibacterales bacterium]|nr:hypothetical protein [Bryobacterales bacterium]